MSCGVAEARPGYVPSELIAAYREVVRLHTQLSDEVARYKKEIHALLQVLFPEFSLVFADPCRATALRVLESYPSAQAVVEAGVKPLAKLLHELAPRTDGQHTAEQLVTKSERESPGIHAWG